MFDPVAFVAVVMSLGLIPFIVWVIVSRRHKERIELIKQGINPDSNTLALSFPGSKALKWGLIFVAAGLAGILYAAVMREIGDEDLFFFAIASVMVGLALLLYYRLIREQRVRAREIQDSLVATGKYGSYRKLIPEEEEPANK